MFLWQTAQELPLNAHADVFSGARGLNFGMSLHLNPYFGYASIEGSGEAAHLRRFACAFSRKGGKYQHLMSLLIFLDTVNSEIFVRGLFSRNFASAKFRDNKTLAKSLCRLLIEVNHALVANFIVTNISYNAVRGNKILAKISEFTVDALVYK